jgi:hypothetical protein
MYTWLSRPWGALSKWGRIPRLTIQIRTRPVDVRFWRNEKPRTPLGHYLHCSNTIISMLLASIRQSIISIIQAGVRLLADGESGTYTEHERARTIARGVYPRHPDDLCWCKEQPRWPNMLARVRMEITSALDGADGSITTSQKLQQKLLQTSDKDMSELIVREWRRNRAVLFPSIDELIEELSDNRGCVIHGNPVLTHVGSLSLHWDIANMYSYKLEDETGGWYNMVSHGYTYPVFFFRVALTDLKRVRKELGWRNSETVEEKRKRGDEGEDAVPSHLRLSRTAE